MSKINTKLIEALNRFNEAVQASRGNSLAAEASAAQEAFLMAMMEMASVDPQDAIEPARRGIHALKDLRGVFEQQILESQKLIAVSDSLIAEFNRAIEKR
jgi:hypothetical protein